MMMGTAEVLVAPTEAVKFVEDLPEDQQAYAAVNDPELGMGLLNMGNTCYMNATLQCLKSVPELRAALNEYDSQSSASSSSSLQTMGSARLTKELGKLFKTLDSSVKPVPPVDFLMRLREKFPQFAQTGQGGMYMQQDAEECWTNIMYCLRECLDTSGSGSRDELGSVQARKLSGIFGIELETKLESTETSETSTEATEAYSLKCNITSDVNYIQEGLLLGLQDDREKMSAELGRDVLFKGRSSITKLPNYLTVQMVRFFYKQEVQQKAKILRPVAFPLILDVYDLCGEQLRKDLEGPRDKKRKLDDDEAGLAKEKAKSSENKAEDTPTIVEGDGVKASADEKVEDTVMEDSSRGTESLTGHYELIAVLTHKGRSADSGHYVSWVKNDKGNWVEFDDETPTPRNQEDIQNLKGGGDWHMAYMCLYKAKKV